MKKRYILGIFVLVAIIGGLQFGLNASAQKADIQDGAIVLEEAAKTNELDAPSTSLLVEDFSFTGPLASNGWTAHSGIGTNPLSTTAGLTYAGYPGSGSGNAALVGNAGGEDANKPLSAEQNTNGGTVYFSALVNVNDAASDKTGDYILHIGDRVAPDAFNLFASRVFVRIVGSSVNFGLSNTSTPTYGTTNFTKNTTYLVIVKYTINTAGNDSTQLWVIPSGVPATEAAAGTPEVNNTTTTGQDTIDAVALRQGSGATSVQTVVDGIRVGTEWADITGGGGGGGTPAGPKLFKSYLNGAAEVPPVSTTASGFGRVFLNAAETQITVSMYWNGLSGNATAGHIHGPAAAGANGSVIFNLAPAAAASGSVVNSTFAVTPAQVTQLKSGLWYFNIHTAANPGGEIRGQILVNKPRFDTDGDGDTDYGIIRPGSGGIGGVATWYTSLNSGTATDPSTITQWGTNADVATPADFDGDGKTDIAFWRPTGVPAFFILRSTDGTLQQVTFGLQGDDPTIVGDYSGDGKAEPAIYRAGATASSQSFFWTLPSSGPLQGVQVVQGWGVGSDFAVPGDYDGDGKFDLVVARNIGGANTFIMFSSQSQVSYTPFGIGSGATPDLVVPGDYDGDGRTDFAVVRNEGSALVWWYRPSSGGADVRVGWGVAGSDIPAQGDYDGNGTTDPAVWRPAGGSTFFALTSPTTVRFQRWGLSTDVPSIYDVHGE